jgi:hypothetical protein
MDDAEDAETAVEGTDTAATAGTRWDPLVDRETAPQSDYTVRQVGIGVAVLLIGLLVVFGLPVLAG